MFTLACVFGEEKYVALLGIRIGGELVRNLVCIYHRVLGLKDILIWGQAGRNYYISKSD